MHVRAIMVGLCLSVTFVACGDDDGEVADQTDLELAPQTTTTTPPGTTGPPIDPDFVDVGAEDAPTEEPTVIEGFELDPVDCSGWDTGTPEEAICQTFSRWLRIDTPDEDRVRMFENGEANADAITDGFETFYDSVKFATAEVLDITMTGELIAEVEFQVRWMGGPSPIFPEPRTGTAVLLEGTWRVSSATSCEMALSLGTDCAGAAAPPSDDVPAATVVVAVPGY